MKRRVNALAVTGERGASVSPYPDNGSLTAPERRASDAEACLMGSALQLSVRVCSSPFAKVISQPWL